MLPRRHLVERLKYYFTGCKASAAVLPQPIMRRFTHHENNDAGDDASGRQVERRRDRRPRHTDKPRRNEGGEAAEDRC